MKSIRKKITVSLMATVLIALIAVGSSSITLNYRSTLATVKEMMSETTVLAAERIEQELSAYKNVAVDTGRIPQLSDEEVSQEEKRPLLMSVSICMGSRGGTSSILTAIASLTGKIILTGSMCSRPCREMSMYRNLWSARLPENCLSW